MALLNSITRIGIIAWLSVCAILIQPVFALPTHTVVTTETIAPVPVTKVPTSRVTSTPTRTPTRQVTAAPTKTPTLRVTATPTKRVPVPTSTATPKPTVITPPTPISPPDEICEDEVTRLTAPHDLLPNDPVGATAGTKYFAPSGPQGASCLSPAKIEQLAQDFFKADLLAKKHFETRWRDPLTSEDILSCTTPVEPVAAKRTAVGSRLLEAMINTNKICTKTSNLMSGGDPDDIQCLDEDDVPPLGRSKVTCCACIYAKRNGPFGDSGDNHRIICEAYKKDPKMWAPEKCDHVEMFPIINEKGEAGGLDQWLKTRNPACTDIRMVTYGHSNAPFLGARQLPMVRCVQEDGKTICSISHQDCGCSSFGDCNLVRQFAEYLQRVLKKSNCDAWIEFNGSPKPQHLPITPPWKICWKNPNGWCNDEYDWFKVMVHKNWIAYYKYDVKSGKWVKITLEEFIKMCSSRRGAGPPVRR